MEKKKIASIYDFYRMCRHDEGCSGCPISGTGIPCGGPGVMSEEQIDIINDSVNKWCEEHPVKTRQSELLKSFPNARIDDNGSVKLCPASIDEKRYADCPKGISCCDCRKLFWSEEIE